MRCNGSDRSHLDEAIVRAGDEEERVAGGVVDAPDALVVRLVLVHRRLRVHVPQRHAALIVAADDVAAHIPATTHAGSSPLGTLRDFLSYSLQSLKRE